MNGSSAAGPSKISRESNDAKDRVQEGQIGETSIDVDEVLSSEAEDANRGS